MTKSPTDIDKILSYYDAENPGTRANIFRILNHGKLAGTGKVLILPVDQGFEHGPTKSFSPNPDAYNPHYHYELAIEAGLNAYAAPLGMLEAGASKFAGQIPTILKINSSNSLMPPGEEPDQAITASVQDALRLGCSAVGLTIYPGSGKSFDMIEEARDIIREAKSYGLASVVWSYPRGKGVARKETSIQTITYAAHMAALIGANIIKVKVPGSIAKGENYDETVLHIAYACCKAAGGSNLGNFDRESINKIIADYIRRLPQRIDPASRRKGLEQAGLLSDMQADVLIQAENLATLDDYELKEFIRLCKAHAEDAVMWFNCILDDNLDPYNKYQGYSLSEEEKESARKQLYEKYEKVREDALVPIKEAFFEFPFMRNGVRAVMQASFDGQRLVVFSGGSKKGDDVLYEEAKAVAQGSGSGSIIGRNTFQRPKAEALEMLDKVIDIIKKYKSEYNSEVSVNTTNNT